MWDEAAAWRFFGDYENNYNTIGNQQSRSDAALIEKLVNSVDARLMNECMIRGVDPESALAPIARADSAQCPIQNAIMNGTYVASGTGSIAGVGPLTTVSLIVYNGDGTGMVVSSTGTVSGASSTSSNVPVTFTVNRDCTGSKTIGTGPSATHMNFVITPDGDTITWIVTNTGVTASGTGVRLKK